MAFSNDIDYKILIPAAVKRECIEALRSQGKTGKVFYLQLFSVALFLLLTDHIDQVSLVTIDPEYKSKDKDIKRFLMNLLRLAGKPVEGDRIRFVRIGKKSRAHKLALATLRGRIEADRVISAKDILEQLVG